MAQEQSPLHQWVWAGLCIYMNCFAAFFEVCDDGLSLPALDGHSLGLSVCLLSGFLSQPITQLA